MKLHLVDLVLDLNRVTVGCVRANSECSLCKKLAGQKGADFMLQHAQKQIVIYGNRFYGPATSIYVDVKKCCVPCVENYYKETLKSEICRDCKLHSQKQK